MTGPPSSGDPRVPAAWTILSLLEWAQAYLVQRGFDEARLHVELMLGHVLGLDRLRLYLQFDRPLTANELAAFKTLFKRRLLHEPLQYILGEAGFMGLSVLVGPGVLIPRPETEVLVEKAIDTLRAASRPGPAVLDIGTGSGNIAIAVARAVPGAHVTGIEASAEALDIARRNCERNGVTNVGLLQGDLVHGLPAGAVFDLVLSNPPYVSREEYERLAPEVRDFEPRAALTDEGDGLGVIRRLFALAGGVLRQEGDMLLEMGAGQEADVTAIARREGWRCVAVYPDLAGIPRVFHAQRTHPQG